MTTTTDTSRREAAKITKDHTRTNIGTIRRTSDRENALNGLGRRVTNRDRVAGNLGTVRRSNRVAGTGGRTIGTARSGTGRTSARAGTTTSMIGMSGLGSATGAVPAAGATPDIAGEHQVTNAKGCIFSSFF